MLRWYMLSKFCGHNHKTTAHPFMYEKKCTVPFDAKKKGYKLMVKKEAVSLINETFLYYIFVF